MTPSNRPRRAVARLASISILLLAILVSFVGPFPQLARATTTITQWTFDNDTLTPAIGSGTATLVGGTTASFATGRVGPRPPDSGWNTTTYPAQGTNSRAAGAQFAVSTAGYENIIFSWDHRHSNTAANTVVLLYSTDGGATFSEASVYTANAGDAWFSRSFDFSAIPAVNNNPNVIFRIVSSFAAGGSTYVASNPTSNYATTGTWRFDNVRVIGSALGSDAAPSVTGTAPANGAANVPVASDVTVTFSEPVAVSGDWFTLACATSGTRTVSASNVAVSGGPISFTINPATDFAFSETCTFTVVATLVSDLDASDPPDTMVADFVATFSTAAPPAPGVRIRDIQGAAHVSPLVPVIADNAISFGSRVENVPGIVTAVRSNGFYLQDPEADANDATSEGIFVFTGSGQAVITQGGSGPVQVGDRLEVSGRPVEIRSGCTSAACTSTSSAWNNLTLTNLNATTSAADNRVIRLISRGNPLPEPVVIGQGGRVPPVTATVFGSPGAAPTNTLETAGYVFNPAANGIDFFESLEGMRVQVNDAVVVGPTNNFGEIVVLADNGAGQGLRTPRGGLVITPTDLNPERIILDDAILPTPQVNVGDRFPGPGAVVGVMDYSFANFKLLITQPLPPAAPGGLLQEVTNLTGAVDRLTIGTFNLENFAADTVTPQRRDAIAQIIVTNMGAPDIVALQEVQDNNGATGGTADTNVDASRTFETLINAIVAAGGPTYAYRQIDPVANQDGGEPGGNIRLAFLFRTDRGLSFVDRPGGDATTAVSVLNNGGRPELSFSPGRIDPTNPAFTNSRKPLAGEFRYNGQTLFVVNNHFNSKGGDQPLSGRFQPPTRLSEVQRHQQAQIVNDFVDSVLAIDPNANIVVLGDLNDFQFSETLNIVKGTPGGVGTPVLFDPKLNQPANEQYTYIFEGNSQVLDSILISRNLRDGGAQYDTVHVNAEFSAATNASDHDPSVLRLYLRPRATPPALVAAGSYNTGLGSNGAEIISVRGDRAVLTNAGDGSIDILDTSDLLNIQRVRRITGVPNLTSAAIHPTKDLFVAVAGASSPRSGQLLVYRLSDGALLATANIGRQPDSVEISPDGRFAVVAIEAEQVSAGDDGGAGAIGVADLSGFDPNASTSVPFSIVELPDLSSLPGVAANRRYDVSGNPLVSNAPGGLEPEGIAFAPDSSAVYVTLQENNAIIRLDLNAPLPATLPASNAFGLGATNHPADLINDGRYDPSQQLTALREPDGVRAVVIGGVTYLVTADEGDTRPNPRGGRTLSIFNAATGELVADAGAQLDDLAASFGVYPDNRSPNGGSEPEMLDVATFAGRVIAAVGLERANAVAFVDISDPAAPRAFSLVRTGAAPEGVKLVERGGQLYALTANEGDGTVTVTTAPVVPLSVSQGFVEDAPAVPLIDLRGIDPDAGDSFTLSLTLTPASAGTLNVTSASGSLADINTTLANLVFTPAPNFNGTATVTATLSDGVFPAVSGSITLTGAPVPPVTSASLSGATRVCCNATVYDPSATLTLTTDEPVLRTQYRVNGGPLQTYTAPVIFATPGAYIVEYFSTDLFAPEVTEAPRTIVFNVSDYPRAPLLDTFDRRDGRLGANWTGNEGLGGYSIRANQVQVFGGGPIYWRARFGSDQEAYVKLIQLDATARHQGLLLKVRNGNWRNGAISVAYDAGAQAVVVETYNRSSRSWTTIGTYPITLQNGDQLGARALSNGMVRVYVNCVLIGQANAGTAFDDEDGQIGLWFINAPGAIFDDFGGGAPPR